MLKSNKLIILGMITILTITACGKKEEVKEDSQPVVIETEVDENAQKWVVSDEEKTDTQSSDIKEQKEEKTEEAVNPVVSGISSEVKEAVEINGKEKDQTICDTNGIKIIFSSYDKEKKEILFHLENTTNEEVLFETKAFLVNGIDDIGSMIKEQVSKNNEIDTVLSLNKSLMKEKKIKKIEKITFEAVATAKSGETLVSVPVIATWQNDPQK